MSADALDFLPDPSRAFPEAFAAHAARDPDAVAFTEITAKGKELTDHPHTFREIETLAARAAHALLGAGVSRGDRVVLCVERPIVFFAWFLAAQRSGAVPVPLPSLGQLDAPAAFRARVRAVCEDCAPRVIVTDGKSSEQNGDTPSLEADSVFAEAREGAPPPVANALTETAFLQYTSGSTGKPKGVIVTHGNLVANFRAIVGGAGFRPTERSYSWLPLYHDMGLIGGFLLGLYMNTGVFVSVPRTFMFRPDSWLRGMTRARATFTVAPNFAYSLVGRKLPDSALAGVDLSSLRLAFNGAEPIDRATVSAFLTRLAPYGLAPNAMYPVFGLAECTLAVAFPAPGSETRYDVVARDALYGRGESVRTPEGDGTIPVISLGRAVPDHTVRIVAVDGDEALPERTVGEVVFEGPSASPGYFGAEPRRTPFVRTGDLGYLADGELYVVDRIKDLVILRGRNFAPSDIERTIAHVKGVTRGSIVAFSRPGEDGTEALVVVAALDATSMRTLAQITADVRRSLAETFSITTVEVVVVAPGTIPKTSSGKVQRRACRELYLRGELDVVDGIGTRAKHMAAKLRTRIGLALSDD